jgi:predicted PP-loop superfamily ATPase
MNLKVLNGSIQDPQVGHQGRCDSAVVQTVVTETGPAQAEIVFFG